MREIDTGQGRQGPLDGRATATLAQAASPRPGAGETVRSAFDKANENFVEIDQRLAALETAGARPAGPSQAAPALIRGTIDAARWPGLVAGSGLDGAQRRRNAQALQQAIDEAARSRCVFELAPGHYEIDDRKGLTVPAIKSGFTWIGSRGSVIEQHADNAPVLTLGDVDGNGDDLQDARITGMRLCYARDQARNPQATALRVGPMRNCVLEQLSILADYGEQGPLRLAYRGIHITSQRRDFGFFSNTVRDVMVGGAAWSLFDMTLTGTGSVFSNLYLTQGVSGHPRPIADSPLRIVGKADLYESAFEQINIEWCIAETLIRARSCRNTTWTSVHLEGNRLVGPTPSALLVIDSELDLRGLNLLDTETADNSGGAAVLRCAGQTVISASGIGLTWSRPAGMKGPCRLVAADRPLPDPSLANQSIDIRALSVHDRPGDNAQWLSLDDSLRGPMPQRLLHYALSGGRSQTTGAHLRTSGPLQLAAAHRDAVVRITGKAPAQAAAARAADPPRPRAAPSPELPPGSTLTVMADAGAGPAAISQGGVPVATVGGGDGTRRFVFDGRQWQPADD